MKYRKKPYVVDAFRPSLDLEPEWFTAECTIVGRYNEEGYGDDGEACWVPFISIRTPKGGFDLRVGTYLLRHDNGAFFSWVEDDFESEFEPVEDAS